MNLFLKVTFLLCIGSSFSFGKYTENLNESSPKPNTKINANAISYESALPQFEVALRNNPQLLIRLNHINLQLKQSGVLSPSVMEVVNVFKNRGSSSSSQLIAFSQSGESFEPQPQEDASDNKPIKFGPLDIILDILIDRVLSSNTLHQNEKHFEKSQDDHEIFVEANINQ